MNINLQLFIAAEGAYEDAVTSASLICDVTANYFNDVPEDFDRSRVDAIISHAASIKTNLDAIGKKIETVKNSLFSGNSQLGMEYNRLQLLEYSDRDVLTPQAQKEVERLYRGYETEEYKYLKSLDKDGTLPPEMVERYEYLKTQMSLYKQSDKMQTTYDEISKLDPNSSKYYAKTEEYLNLQQKYCQTQINYLNSKQNLTDEEKERLKQLKSGVKEINSSKKEIKDIKNTLKDYESLEKLKKQKEKNNAFLHPVKENKLAAKINKLEEKLGCEKSLWYFSIGDSVKDTGAAWGKGFSDLLSGKGVGSLGDAFKQTAATGVVVGTSLKSGIMNIGEGIADGIEIGLGYLGAGCTWLLHDSWSKNNYADNIVDAVWDDVRVDKVGEMNKFFYEDTSLGKWINKNSNLKYNSSGAQSLQTGTELVGKIVLATGLTVVTGGVAAPLIVGALYGAGNATERYAQSVDREAGESYNYGEGTLRAIGGGVGGAAEFYGYGQIGAGLLNGYKAVQAAGGFKNVLSSKATSGATTSFGKNFVKNFLEIDTLVDTGSVVYDHAINYAFGDESLNDALKYGGLELLFALGLNAAGAGMSAKAAPILEGKLATALSEIEAPGDLDMLDNLSINNNTVDNASAASNVLSPSSMSMEGELPGNIKIVDNAYTTPEAVDHSRLNISDNLSGNSKAVDNAINTQKTTGPNRLNISDDLSGNSKVVDNAVNTQKTTGPNRLNISDDLLGNSKVVNNVVDSKDALIINGLNKAGDLDDIDKSYVINNTANDGTDINDKLGVLDELNISEDERMSNIFLKQKERFNNIKGTYIDNKTLNINEDGKVYFKEGTIFHGTQFDEARIASTAETGILTGQAYGIPEDGETFYHADFYRVKEDIAITDYNQNAISTQFDIAARTPFTNRNRSKNSIAYIIEPSNNSALDELMSYDPYRSGTTNGEIAEEFIAGLPSDDNAALSSILYGVPSEAISGIVVGDDIAKSVTKIETLRQNFPDVYIVSRNGDIIYNNTKVNLDSNVINNVSNNTFESTGILSPGAKNIADNVVSSGNTNGFRAAGDLTSTNGFRAADLPENVNIKTKITDSKSITGSGKLKISDNLSGGRKAVNLETKITNSKDITGSGKLKISDNLNGGRKAVNIVDNTNSTRVKSSVFDFVDTTDRDLNLINRFLEHKASGDSHQFIYLKSGAVNWDISKEAFAKGLIETFPDLDLEQDDIFQLDHFTKNIDLSTTSRRDYSYRISLLADESLSSSELLAFTKKFDEICIDKNLPYNIKVDPTNHDVFVIYTDADKLNDFVKILDDLADENVVGKKIADITKNFGEQKPFSAAIKDDAYYGISMGGPNTLKSGDLKGGTFSNYSQHLLDEAYTNLSAKYNGDISKITPTEMLDEMHNVHNKIFGFDPNENVPLWMNRELYDASAIVKNIDDVKVMSGEIFDDNIMLNNLDNLQNPTNSRLKMSDNLKNANSSKRIFDDIYGTLYNKYGADDALLRIKKYIETGNINLITRDNNARALITSLSKDDLVKYIDEVKISNIKTHNYSVEEMAGFYDNLGKSYGQDQGAIKNLCEYYYNGNKLSYYQAKDLVNNAISKGQPIPHIIKRGTPEYFDIKNNLMLKNGFSNETASVIMSSVDDAGACSYASVCNEIFYKFKDAPSRFEEIFGYPMYKMNNGVKSLNTNDLLLDLYVYANKIENGGKLIDGNVLNPKSLSTKIDALGREMPDVGNNQIYMSNGKTGRNTNVINDFLKSKDTNLEFTSEIFFNNMNKSVFTENDYNIIMNKLIDRVNNGSTASMGIYYNPKNNDNIIRMLSYDKSSYPDTSTAVWHEGGGHSVTITGIYSDGITVSSWGEKYFIPKEDLINGGRFMISTSNINGI